jgi:hypothetical protein
MTKYLVPVVQKPVSLTLKQLVYDFRDISSEILSGSIRVFFNKSFEVNRRVEIHKLKHWVKFQPRISANIALNNWPQGINPCSLMFKSLNFMKKFRYLQHY